MAFDLNVHLERLPDALKELWEQAFRAHGVELEIWPSFQPATWQGGFLPMRLRGAPAELVGVPISEDAAAGIEVWFDESGAYFRSAAGRTTTEFALQCLGAALLAELGNGSYFDPQAGETHASADAVAAARREIESFVAGAEDEELLVQPFPGWAAYR
jgi:hypothetical protein